MGEAERRGEKGGAASKTDSMGHKSSHPVGTEIADELALVHVQNILLSKGTTG